MASTKRIAVVGAGVIGLSSALRLVQSSNSNQFEVTLISKEFSPATTGDGSAGYIYSPYLCDEPKEEMREMFKQTFEFYMSLCQKGLDVGIATLPGYHLYEKENHDADFYKDIFLQYRQLSLAEVRKFNQERFKYGHYVLTLFAECSKLLPWMLEQFKKAGGKVLVKEMKSFEELSDYDCVLNCTGLSAKKLVDDQKLRPVRGQVHRVRAPWVKFALFAGDAYIIPNSDTVTLGGTKQDNDWNQTVDPIDQRKIFSECTKLLPALKNADRVLDWVGLRPYRDSVRIELVWTVLTNGKRLPIVHNYGHGGSGVSMGWGSASKAIGVLMTALNVQKSKL